MAELTFRDVLDREDIPATDVTVMLHSPQQAALLAVLPAMVRTNRAAMEAYQATHAAGAEAALKQRRPWVASFVKVGQDVPSSHSRMLFAGLYRNEGWRDRSWAAIMAAPEIAFLHETYQTHGEFASRDPDRTWTWFDLGLDERLSYLQGRLVVSVRLTPNYVRRAENLDAAVRAIHEESIFDAAPPDWRTWVVPSSVLRALPPGWASRLREWRGIYLICDRTDGMRYVGSAYGQTNFLGRWLEHTRREVGVTKRLAERDPKNFDFTILETTAPTAEPEDVIAIEHGWMARLHTKTFGLNA